MAVATDGSNTGSGRQVVFTCVGSLGDLHPYLALAAELGRRGHRPVVATVPWFRNRVEAAGLPFAPLRATSQERPDAAVVWRVFNGLRGIEYIIRDLILPSLRTAYEDTCAAATNADLLIAHPLTLATRIVAEDRGLPWLSTQLAPLGMQSAVDPPLLPAFGWLPRAAGSRWGAALFRALYRLASWRTRPWVRPYYRLRTELGLPESGNPLLEAAHSPFGELALFSPLFAEPQADWPQNAVATGFPIFSPPAAGADPALEEWLAAGPPPLIFTLGSSAVWMPGEFFRESALAAARLGRRALLLGATSEEAERLQGTGAEIFACPYAPYGEVFPRGAAVVHQGGIGTTAEALRAGQPTLIVPFGADQPDNAVRTVRLGVGLTLRRGAYRAKRVARALSRLLDSEETFRERAAALGRRLRAENGAAAACDRIEAQLAGRRGGLSGSAQRAGPVAG